MRLFTHMLNTILHLRHDERGAAFPLIAVMSMAMIGAMGAAIDMGRAQMVQARISSALDAAGLAAGANVSTTADLNAEVNKYFYANFPQNYMGAEITSVTATPNSDNTVITLSAEGTVGTSLMRVLGIDTVNVGADSEITRTNRGMEVVMVLDITGSMWSGNNHLNLRTASTDLVNVLFGDRQTVDNLWVGIVPYVTAVNVGSQSQAQNWLTTYDLTRYPANYPAAAVKWKGCVEERASPADTTDDPPVAGSSAAALATRFPMFFWEDTPAYSSAGDNNWIQGGNVVLHDPIGYGDNDSASSNNGGKGPNISCGESVLAMTSNKQTILNKINALVPYRKGGTASSSGVAWGWRMLSPKWRGLWDHELVDGQVALPLDYRTPLMDKVMIIETDGINEFFRSATNGTTPYTDYTAYRRLNTTANGGRPDFNTTSRATGVTIVNNKTAAMCTAMKQQGILIYTVTFNLGNTTAANNARTLFRNCASRPEYYFDAGNTADGLRDAFRRIGDSLANLRISK